MPFECTNLASLPDHVGCEFYGVTMDNELTAGFRGGMVDGGQGTAISGFGFRVLASPGAPLTFNVFRLLNGVNDLAASVSIAGDASEDVFLPWQSIGSIGTNFGNGWSGRQSYAWRITSSRPVSVQQMNPLRPDLRTTTACTSDAACTAPNICLTNLPRVCGEPNYTQDGTLLIPRHKLGTAYIATAIENAAFTATADAGAAPTGELNSELTIVATVANTMVTVRASTQLRAGPGIAQVAAGQTVTYQLNASDVLQLSTMHTTRPYVECVTNPNDTSTSCTLGGVCQKICREANDLSATVVTADQPIAVFVGSPCTLKPTNVAACDHVEEQLAPVNTLGATHLLTPAAGVRSSSGTLLPGAPQYFKVTAVCGASQCPSGTRLTFSTTPTLANVFIPNRCSAGFLSTNDCDLPGGASMEFSTTIAMVLSSNQPVQVMHFIPGQQASGTTAVTGDPSMALVTPSEQWTRVPWFSTINGNRDGWVRLAWDSAAVTGVAVDGTPVTGVAVANSSLVFANVSVNAGTHVVSTNPAGQPVGVELYGYTTFSSYATMGPRDFRVIAPTLVP